MRESRTLPRLGTCFAPISNVIALPQHLFALLLKIVTFNTVLMVLKIVILLYNGHLCFFNGDRFEVICKYYTCVMYTSYIVHRSCFLMCLTWFCLILNKYSKVSVFLVMHNASWINNYIFLVM